MSSAITDSSTVTLRRGDPQACYKKWRSERGDGDGLLQVEFSLEQYWLEGCPALDLTALYHVSSGALRVAVTDQVLRVDGCTAVEQFRRWLARHELAAFDPGAALELAPETVAKPWGQELWYTAVERRGVCTFAAGAARTPIPWLQAALPEGCAGNRGEALVLLKILDPAPQPVVGELYFELHEEKREVYVVTHVDTRAWPDGVGFIRYGFDPARLAQYAGPAEFRDAYLTAVQAYEAVRRELDGLPQNAGPTPEQLNREQSLREQMNSFTALRPLRVGDVIEIPLLMPHSLLHGVRVIEFQTPSYERKILSFAQQVLTQQHWDTPEAVARMRLTPPREQPFARDCPQPGVVLEQIVDFPDFAVLRVVIERGHSWQTQVPQAYALLIVAQGVLRVSGVDYQAGRALLSPHNWAAELTAAQAAQPLVLLLARPRG